MVPADPEELRQLRAAAERGRVIPILPTGWRLVVPPADERAADAAPLSDCPTGAAAPGR